MSILHTVNKSPYEHNTLASCLNVIGSDHCLLLIEDGVYGAQKQSPLSDRMTALRNQGTKIYVLAEDMDCRGIKHSILEGIELIEYPKFVSLTIENQSMTSWY